MDCNDLNFRLCKHLLSMSLNTAHVSGGVLIHNGERILLYCKDVTLDFHNVSDSNSSSIKGSRQGKLYLTTHRMIFQNKSSKDKLISFSFPFCTLDGVELEQPVFGANYIKGKVTAQPDGGWTGEAKFKLHFKSGGAIEYGQAMLQAAKLAARAANFPQAPPPYSPPGSYYMAPPPAYSAPNEGYYGWIPPTNVFPDRPTDDVYMSEQPPPYPGIVNNYAEAPSAPPVNNQYYPQNQPANAYYQPHNPGMAYIPVHSDPPPAYEYESPNKKNQ